MSSSDSSGSQDHRTADVPVLHMPLSTSPLSSPRGFSHASRSPSPRHNGFTTLAPSAPVQIPMPIIPTAPLQSPTRPLAFKSPTLQSAFESEVPQSRSPTGTLHSFTEELTKEIEAIHQASTSSPVNSPNSGSPSHASSPARSSLKHSLSKKNVSVSFDQSAPTIMEYESLTPENSYGDEEENTNATLSTVSTATYDFAAFDQHTPINPEELLNTSFQSVWETITNTSDIMPRTGRPLPPPPPQIGDSDTEEETAEAEEQEIDLSRDEITENRSRMSLEERLDAVLEADSSAVGPMGNQETVETVENVPSNRRKFDIDAYHMDVLLHQVSAPPSPERCGEPVFSVRNSSDFDLRLHSELQRKDSLRENERKIATSGGTSAGLRGLEIRDGNANERIRKLSSISIDNAAMPSFPAAESGDLESICLDSESSETVEEPKEKLEDISLLQDDLETEERSRRRSEDISAGITDKATSEDGNTGNTGETEEIAKQIFEEMRQQLPEGDAETSQEESSENISDGTVVHMPGAGLEESADRISESKPQAETGLQTQTISSQLPHMPYKFSPQLNESDSADTSEGSLKELNGLFSPPLPHDSDGAGTASEPSDTSDASDVSGLADPGSKSDIHDNRNDSTDDILVEIDEADITLPVFVPSEDSSWESALQATGIVSEDPLPSQDAVVECVARKSASESPKRVNRATTGRRTGSVSPKRNVLSPTNYTQVGKPKMPLSGTPSFHNKSLDAGLGLGLGLGIRSSVPASTGNQTSSSLDLPAVDPLGDDFSFAEELSRFWEQSSDGTPVESGITELEANAETSGTTKQEETPETKEINLEPRNSAPAFYLSDPQAVHAIWSSHGPRRSGFGIDTPHQSICVHSDSDSSSSVVRQTPEPTIRVPKSRQADNAVLPSIAPEEVRRISITKRRVSDEMFKLCGIESGTTQVAQPDKPDIHRGQTATVAYTDIGPKVVPKTVPKVAQKVAPLTVSTTRAVAEKLHDAVERNIAEEISKDPEPADLLLLDTSFMEGVTFSEEITDEFDRVISIQQRGYAVRENKNVIVAKLDKNSKSGPRKSDIFGRIPTMPRKGLAEPQSNQQPRQQTAAGQRQPIGRSLLAERDPVADSQQNSLQKRRSERKLTERKFEPKEPTERKDHKEYKEHKTKTETEVETAIESSEDPNSRAESTEKGRLYCKILGLKNIELPDIAGKKAEISLVLDNGIHCISTPRVPLRGPTSMIDQEFELIVEDSLEFIVTFKIWYSKGKRHGKQSSGSAGTLAKLFGGSPKKRKALRNANGTEVSDVSWDGKIAADGSFARAYVDFSKYEAQVRHKVRGFEIDTFNEWTTEKSGKSAGKLKPPYRIAQLEVKMLYVEADIGAAEPGFYPGSIRAALQEAKQLQARQRCHYEGFLWQNGGDCRRWKRRLYVLRGKDLVAYSETHKTAVANINLLNAKSVFSDVIDATKLASVSGGPKGGHSAVHSFKLQFENGEIIEFRAESEKRQTEWRKELEFAIEVNRPKKLWVEDLYAELTR